MSTPNPLIPQGSFQSQAQGASNVRLAVATIVAIHVVFFGGLLLQGCKRDTPVAAEDASEAVTETNNLTLPPIDTASLYYTNAENLPTESGGIASAPYDSSTLGSAAPANTSGPTGSLAGAYTGVVGNGSPTTQDVWQASNFNSAVAPATQSGFPAESAAGPMREHTVVRGDYFEKIARNYGTTVSAIMDANPGVDPRKIRPGMKIKVPAASAPSSQSAAVAPSSSESSGTVYTVVAGDNLTKIARKYGVTIRQIRDANNMRTTRVNVGQRLRIPSAAPKTQASNAPAF